MIIKKLLPALLIGFGVSFWLGITAAKADPPYSTSGGVQAVLEDIAEPLNNRWNYAAAASGIANTTTAVTIKAAVAAVRNCITSFSLQSATLGAATEFAIRDGAAGAVLFRTQLQTTAMPLHSVKLGTPLCGTVNTLLEVVTLTAATGGVYFNAQGFTQ